MKDLIESLCKNISEKDPILPMCESDFLDEDQLYSAFMKIMCDLEMDEDTARYHYEQIVTHMKRLEEINKREIGFRVSMLDYLLNINPRLTAPRFIELDDYGKMLELSTLDGLTGVYNKRYFENYLDREIHRCARHGYTFSLLLLDLDDFKKVNDKYGHVTGDSVLRDFASLMKNLLRSEDISARFGGEEFIILLPHTDLQGAQVFAERLLEKTRTHIYSHGKKITFSGGISNFPLHGHGAEKLVTVADKGLYAVKLRGKDGISIPDTERRDSRRYDTDTNLAFEADDRGRHQGKIRNISITGIAGETEVRLKPGQVITLEFSGQDKADYHVHAQIVWIDKYAETDPYLFGARYYEVPSHTIFHVLDRVVPDGYLDIESE